MQLVNKNRCSGAFLCNVVTRLYYLHHRSVCDMETGRTRNTSSVTYFYRKCNILISRRLRSTRWHRKRMLRAQVRTDTPIRSYRLPCQNIAVLTNLSRETYSSLNKNKFCIFLNVCRWVTTLGEIKNILPTIASYLK